MKWIVNKSAERQRALAESLTCAWARLITLSSPAHVHPQVAFVSPPVKETAILYWTRVVALSVVHTTALWISASPYDIPDY